jgi:hypothetical protein
MYSKVFQKSTDIVTEAFTIISEKSLKNSSRTYT